MDWWDDLFFAVVETASDLFQDWRRRRKNKKAMNDE